MISSHFLDQVLRSKLRNQPQNQRWDQQLKRFYYLQETIHVLFLNTTS